MKYTIAMSGRLEAGVLDHTLGVLIPPPQPDDQVFVYMANGAGGSMGAGLALYDLLISLPCTVTCIASGQCASAHVPILLAGDVRLCTPHTNFMMHRVVIVPREAQGEFNARQLQNLAKVLEVDDSFLLDIFRDRASFPDNVLSRAFDCSEDIVFTPREALEWRLVHRLATTGEMAAMLSGLPSEDETKSFDLEED